MKFILFVLAMVVAAAVASTLTLKQEQQLFTKFAQQFNKQYETSEVFKKFATFQSNLDLIISHNAKNLSYKMGVNQFADMSAVEFAESMFFGMPKNAATTVDDSELAELTGMTLQSNAEAIDWRNTAGVVGPIRNQASCGSCWAFSSTGALTGAVAIASGKSLDFSTQQLVDCSRDQGNEGCNGGLMDLAFDYYQAAGGACLEQDYPYTARDGACQKSCKPAATVTGYQAIATNADAHYAALKNGPTAITLAASSSAFQFFSSGVVKASQCTDRSRNHALVAVAWTPEAGDVPAYFTIANSWGASWGQNGYINLEAGACFFTKSNWDQAITSVKVF